VSDNERNVRAVQRFTALALESVFLLERLDDWFERSDLDSDAYREWAGHVVPSIERLRSLHKMILADEANGQAIPAAQLDQNGDKS
jgi:hypothetical protein